MDGENKTGTSEKKSILDKKSDKVEEEMDSPSNSDERKIRIKGTVIRKKNDFGEKLRKQGNQSQHCQHQTKMRR